MKIPKETQKKDDSDAYNDWCHGEDCWLDGVLVVVRERRRRLKKREERTGTVTATARNER